MIHRSSGREGVANAGFAGNLGAMRITLRVVIGALVVAIVAIATIPLLVLRDLSSGGTGWGLCSEGMDGCSNSYFAGFELVAALLLALLAVLVLLRIATKTLRWVEHRYDVTRSAAGRLDFSPSEPARVTEDERRKTKDEKTPDSGLRTKLEN